MGINLEIWRFGNGGGSLAAPRDFQISKSPNFASTTCRYAFLFTFAFLAVTSVAHGQVTSRLGRFQVDQVKGCAPFTITITTTNLITVGECTGGKPCLMTFEPGQVCPANPTCKNEFTYSYATPGTFTLSVLYQSIGSDDISVTVVPNIQPAFEVYTCSSNRVSIKVTDKNYDQYFIDFGDGSPVVGIPFSNNQVASHNYPGSGNFPISIHGKNLNSADNCNALAQTFSAINVLPTPTINTLTAIDANRLRLDFTAAAHLQLHMEIAVNNDATFQLFQTLYGVSTDTVSNLKLDNNYYCFRLSAYDPCTGNNTYSNTICSQVFTATAVSGMNQLAWNTSPTGVTDFGIARDQAPYTTTATQSYDDAGVVCLTNYCYQVTSNYGNGSKSISLEKCAMAFTLAIPSIIDEVSSVVDGNQVSFSWLQDPAFTTTAYSIYRSSASGSSQLLGTVSATSFIDPNYSTSANLCYRIDYQDECGNLSPNGTTFCPLRLSGTLDSQNAITLSWNGYEGWVDGVKDYALEKYDQQGNLITTIDVGTQTTYLDDQADLVNQIVSYKLIATPNNAAMTNSISNIARFTKGINLFGPNAFTPNGDSVNDGFIVSGHYINNMELSIFDRWGTLIFSAGKDESWDGTYNGKLMPETSYAWKADGTDISGRHFTHTGMVVLLKKGK